MRTAVYTARDRRLANLIWRHGPLSRAELMGLSGVHRNLVGTSADRLLKLGLVREAWARTTGPGRPSLPLEINPAGKGVLGISVSPGRVESVALSLRGDRIGRPDEVETRVPHRLVSAASLLLRKGLNDSMIAVGVSVTGLVDLDARTLLFGSATSATRDVSLDPLYAAAGDRPLVIDNDQHALAARWLLTHRAGPKEDILLVGFDDGRMGASHLVDGRPSRGCVLSANEIGHTRLPVETPRCYCGHTGCLERICSSDFVHLHGGTKRLTLDALADDPTRSSAVFAQLIDALACGFSNAVNFTRPDRLILSSPLGRRPAFADAVTQGVRSRVLPALVDRVRIEWWDEPLGVSAENAAWLALASAFYDGWTDANTEYDITRATPDED